MAHIDHGNVLLNQGRLEEAEESYRGALKLKAGYPIPRTIGVPSGRLMDAGSYS